MQRLIPIFAAALGAPITMAASPQINVTVNQTHTIYTATTSTSSVPGFKPHINFPYLKQRANGSLEVTFTVGQTHGEGRFGMRAYSSDGGVTWSGHTSAFPPIPNSALVRPPGQGSYGISGAHDNPSGFTGWSSGRFTSFNGGLSWAAEPATFDTSGVLYVSAYNNLCDMIDVGGTLMTTMQMQRHGASTYETVLFTSNDNALTWQRRSTIASYVAGPNTSMGSEGPTESSVVQLNNGNLLSVYRTGQPFPTTDVNATSPSLFWSISSDEGLTWSAPKMLGVAGVFPLLRKLDDGTVALSYGRYGAKVMFADETGLRWTTPTVIYNGPTSGHTELRRNNNGTYTFVYDQSSFYPPSWNASPPPGYVYDNDQSAHLKSAILTITRQHVPEPFAWAGRYDGDLTPDSLPQPWSRSIGGSPSAYLWADQGQDYLRIDTGASGTSRHLYYALGAESAWDAMDFGQGTVIDLRARVGSATAEGAADFFFGDGTHGYAILELTGTSVILQGMGGNDGQAVHLASTRPGFSTTDWHEYRLVIGPDASAGGDLRAQLFVDGDFASPLLSIALDPTLINQLWFGDGTSTSNGRLDVDYLRFAAVPEPSTLLLAAVSAALLARRARAARLSEESHEQQ